MERRTRVRRPRKADIDEELHSILSQLEDELEAPMVDEDFDDDLTSMDEIDLEEEIVEEDDLEAEIEDLEMQLEEEVPEEACMISREDIRAEITQLESQLSAQDDDEVEEASDEDVPAVEDVENEIEDDVGGGDPSLSVEFPEYAPDEDTPRIKDVVGSRQASKVKSALRRLNKIAEVLERKGDKRHAAAVDMVANTIESETGITEASF